MMPISRAEFQKLVSQVDVPCLITDNDAEKGLILAAYQFMWEDNDRAVLIQLPTSPGLTVGDSCRYRSVGARGRVTPGRPLDAESIAELNAAKQEFLPRKFAD